MSQDVSEVWIVPPDLTGKTLSAGLRKFCPEKTWSQVRRLIDAYRVTVNRTLELDESRRLTAGEQIAVLSCPLPPPPDDDDVVVRYFDDSLVVVEKPTGMLSLRHIQELNWPPPRRRRQTSLDEVVLRAISQREQHPRDLSTQPPHLRRRHLRSVHRIDRDTSGLLVFARTPAARKHLVEQFSSHTIRRRYLAVVSGQPPIGEIRTRLVRDRGDGRRGSTTSATDGKAAVTFVRHVEVLGNFSLVQCELETGRTHQIRIHLAECGFPVCGDWMYRAPAGAPDIADESNSPRLALHASELAFGHPVSGEEICFEADLPPDLSRLIE
ncbi:MAG: RluA family pseudouridine synthase, partial [Planctomycetaceae bacterium]